MNTQPPHSPHSPHSTEGRTAATAFLLATMRDRQADFLSQLSLLLGLPPSDTPLRPAPHHFVGPTGLVCRVHMHEDELAVRIETVLPMSAAEFMGPEVARLLAVQGALLNEFGWRLGLSDDGLLQLSCAGWIDNPNDAATALDFANGLGMAVVRSLLLDGLPAATKSTPS